MLIINYMLTQYSLSVKRLSFPLVPTMDFRDELQIFSKGMFRQNDFLLARPRHQFGDECS